MRTLPADNPSRGTSPSKGAPFARESAQWRVVLHVGSASGPASTASSWVGCLQRWRGGRASHAPQQHATESQPGPPPPPEQQQLGDDQGSSAPAEGRARADSVRGDSGGDSSASIAAAGPAAAGPSCEIPSAVAVRATNTNGGGDVRSASGTGALPPAGNRVVTSKYTLLTFVPVFLFEVFSRVAYLYFLLQAALSWWREVSPFSGIGSTAALVFVVAISAAKAAVEDVRRHMEDRATNRARTRRLLEDGSTVEVRWQDVRVGDILEVRNGELLPTDLLLLRAGLPEGVAFVRTTNLDGETNLKVRRAVRLPGWEDHELDASGDEAVDVDGAARDGSCSSGAGGDSSSRSGTSSSSADIIEERGDAGDSGGEGGSSSGSESDESQTVRARQLQLLIRVRGVVECEPPSRSLHSFTGGLRLESPPPPPPPSRVPGQRSRVAHGSEEAVVQDQATGADPRPPQQQTTVPLSMDNMLLRGCVLKNSEYVLGLAVYCGPQTRIQMNAVRPPLKVGSFDRFLNKQILVLLLLQLLLSVASAVGSYAWREREGVRRPHLALRDPVQGNWQSPVTYIVLLSITFWILYGYLVPISLFVTMELVKFWQAFVFINYDPALTEEPPEPTQQCRRHARLHHHHHQHQHHHQHHQHRHPSSPTDQSDQLAPPSDQMVAGAAPSGADNAPTGHHERSHGPQLSLHPHRHPGSHDRHLTPGDAGAPGLDDREQYDGGGAHGGANEAGNGGAGRYGATAPAHAFARSSAVNEDLGRVVMVFSDKTGTLTRNDMRLRCCTLGADRFGSLEERLEERPRLRGMSAVEAFDPRLAQALAAFGRAGAWRSSVEGGGTRGLLTASTTLTPYPTVHMTHAGQTNNPGNANSTSSAETASPQGRRRHPLPGPAREASFPLRPGLDQEQVAYSDPHRNVDAHLDPDPDSDSELQQLALRWVSFWLGVCLCNSVVLEPHPAGDRPPAYQGPSPDEVALLEAARQLGFELASRGRDTLDIKVAHPPSAPASPSAPAPPSAPALPSASAPPLALPQSPAATPEAGPLGETDGAAGDWMVVRYRVLNVLEFSSARKRMSVVVEAPDGSLALHTKGADSVVIPRLAGAVVSAPVAAVTAGGSRPAAARHEGVEQDNELVAAAEESLHFFASQGLRTLVLAARPLPDRGWYDNWDGRYQEAAAAVHTDPWVRAAALDSLADEIERDLQLVGVAAIEDRLQEGVPAAVATLLAAGVRVWMITGDKLETAVNIARSARLLTQAHDSQLLVLREHDEAAIRQQLRNLSQRAAAINGAVRGGKADSKGRRLAMRDGKAGAAAAEVAEVAAPDKAQKSSLELSVRRDGQHGQQTQQPPQEPVPEHAAPAGPVEEFPGVSVEAGDRPRERVSNASSDPWASDINMDTAAAATTAAATAVAAGAAAVSARPQLTPLLPSLAQHPTPSRDVGERHSTAPHGTDTGSGGGGGGGVVSTAAELVVDGRTLDTILERRPLAGCLAALCASCASVVICRASPAQKAALVKLMRAHRQRVVAARRRRRWRWLTSGGFAPVLAKLLGPPAAAMRRFRAMLSYTRPARAAGDSDDDGQCEGDERGEHVGWSECGAGEAEADDPWVREGVLLAIGDGANDVAMLQAADVGVGVMGKEGRQAVNNSDVAVPLFRHLVPLLLVHGQLCSERLSRLITYSFYKNLVYWGVLLMFQFYCGFSGQALIDDISGSFYNVVFTAAPILVVALQESHAPEPATTLLEHPELYNAHPPLSPARFWSEGVALPLLHSAACFFVPMYSATPYGAEPSHGLWVVGKAAYMAVVVVVTAELLLTTRAWTRLLGVVCALSVAVTFPFLLLVWRVELAVDYVDEATVGTADLLYKSPYFWLSLIAVVSLTAGTRYMERAVRWIYFPDPFMRLGRQHVRLSHRARQHPKGLPPAEGGAGASEGPATAAALADDNKSGGNEPAP